MPQSKKANKRSLSQREIAMLIKYIDGNELEIAILLSLWLGLRRSEVFGLKWSDIDYDNNTITIQRAKVPGEHSRLTEKTTKTTESTRILHLPEYLKSKLINQEHHTEYLINYSVSHLSKKFKNICKELNIQNITFHDLRRTMATLGVKLNISDKLMMARGGWSNPQTMKKIYQMATIEDINTADIMIDDYLNGLIS